MQRIYTTDIDTKSYERMLSRKRGVLLLDRPSSCSEGDIIFIENGSNKKRLRTKVLTYVCTHSIRLAVVQVA